MDGRPWVDAREAPTEPSVVVVVAPRVTTSGSARRRERKRSALAFPVPWCPWALRVTDVPTFLHLCRLSGSNLGPALEQFPPARSGRTDARSQGRRHMAGASRRPSLTVVLPTRAVFTMEPTGFSQPPCGEARPCLSMLIGGSADGTNDLITLLTYSGTGGHWGHQGEPVWILGIDPAGPRCATRSWYSRGSF
jgi:hypothetical protein